MSNATISHLDLKVPYVLLLSLTFIVWIALLLLDAPLRNDAAPLGIVSLELAGSGEGARSILEAWNPQQQVMAGASLGLDYLFLILYPLCISQACRYLAAARQTGVSSRLNAGLLIARLQLVASPLDAIENTALLMEFVAPESMKQWATMAWWCAVPKFSIILIGLLYISIGFSKHACTVPQSGFHRD